jgi:hypothetical protein
MSGTGSQPHLADMPWQERRRRTATLALPEHPGLAAYHDLADSLRVLNCPHIAEFVLAGRSAPFRVYDGVFVRSGAFSWRRVDAYYLEQVRIAWRQDPDPRLRAAADHVVDIVQQAMARENSALRRLAVFQLRQLLCAAHGPGTPPGQLRARILAMGVVADEADELAAAVASACDGPAPDDVVKLIAARRSNQLRRAARLAALLRPVARDHVLLALLDDVRSDTRRVDDLLATGARRKDGGDFEGAAAAYLRAAAIAADEPVIGNALRQCVPPPPEEPEAHVTGRQVTLSWRPSAASAGAITYRVTRVTGAAAPPSVLAQGPDTSVVDRDPPTGPALAYHVVAVRAGLAESSPAVTARFRVVPDVEDLVVTEHRGCVAGSWRVPPTAAAVRVTRCSGTPEEDEIAVPSGRTSFQDSGITADKTYVYRIACGYPDLAGGLAWSTGRSSRILASRWPDPVTGLEVTGGPRGDTLCLRWLSPGTGQVAVVLGTSAMPADGSALAAGEVSSLGAVAWQGTAVAAGSPMSCEIPVAGAGSRQLAMVTVLDDRAVVGETRLVDVLDGFHGLSARRTGDSIELTWAWPAAAQVSMASVHWEYAGADVTAGPGQRVSRDSYHRRGVLIPASERGFRFTVSPLSAIAGSVSVGPSATAELDARHDLAYEILRVGNGRRARRVATLRLADPPSELPEFLLVARPGTVRPTRKEQGTVVLRVGAASTGPGSPAAAGHRIDLSAVPPPYYLLGFLAGPAAAGFRLIHPPRTQLLVER